MYPEYNRCLLHIYNLKMPQSQLVQNPSVYFLKCQEYWSNGQYNISVLGGPTGGREIHGMIRFVNQNGVDATKLLIFTHIFNYCTKHGVIILGMWVYL